MNLVIQRGYISYTSPEKDLVLDIGGESVLLSSRGSVYRDENNFSISNFEGEIALSDVSVAPGMGYSICDKEVNPLPDFAGLKSPGKRASYSFKRLKNTFGVKFEFGENLQEGLYHLIVRDTDRTLIDILTTRNEVFLLLAPGEYTYTSSIIDNSGKESEPETGSITIKI